MENIEKKVRELYEKAQYHKNIANNYREKLEAFLEKPLAEPQDGLETLGDVIDYMKRLEKKKEIALEEIYEGEQILNVYYRKKAEEEEKLASIKIYEKPHTPISLIISLLNKSMTFSDLVKYFQRICHGFSNKKN